MICPRCGEIVDDIETICPYCLQDIDKNAEFNDFRQDGFVQIQQKNETDTSEPINYLPKYLDVAEMNIFVLAVVFVLVISVMTVFSFRFLQKTKVEYVPAYIIKTEVTAETEPTEKATEKAIKKYTIKDIIGSWKIQGYEETDTTAIPYYSFAEDGVAQENYGSITVAGSYKDLSEGKKKTVYIDIEGSFTGAFEFSLSIDNDKKTILTLVEVSSSRVYVLEKSEAKAKKISPSAKQVLDNLLMGYWLSDDKDKSYEFRIDGTATRVSGPTTTECVWTVDGNNVLTIKYMKNEVRSINLDYIVKKNRLYINKTLYKKTEKESD